MDLTDTQIVLSCSGSGAQGVNDYEFLIDLFEKIDPNVCVDDVTIFYSFLTSALFCRRAHIRLWTVKLM